MKNFIINLGKKIMLVLSLMYSLNSCTDDLNVTPTDDDYSTIDDFFKKEGSYKAYLGKLYGGLAVSGPNGEGSSDIQGLDNGFGQYLRAYWMMQEVPTDEAILGWVNDAGVIDMSAGTFDATNQFVNAMFLRIAYQTRITSEFLLQTTDDKLNSRGVSVDLKNEINVYRAEARFLRALSYYHGLELFGKAVKIDESSPVGFVYLPEIGGQELYNLIESELLAIENQLPNPKTAEQYRVDKAGVWMLLANLYLNSETFIGVAKYDKARDYAEKVIGSAYKIDETKNYQHLFMADNNSNGAQNEIIFAVQNDGTSLRNYGSTTFIINASIGGKMTPSDYGTNQTWGGLRTRREFVKHFDGLTDQRARFFTEGQSLDIAAIGPEFKEGYAVTKFTNKTSTGNSGSNTTFNDTDFPLFRLAEAYLIYAESASRGFGSKSTAANYINSLRKRAKNPSLVAESDITPRFVLAERARELYWEGKRRQDLIRFGLFAGTEYLWQWKANSINGGALPVSRNLYPIPEKQRNTNPNLTQNPGY